MKIPAAEMQEPVMFLESLEDRRMMSVGAIINKGAVRIETSLGRITLLLTPNVTPLTVNNFLQNYVDKGLYNNTIVHRSVPGFIIQLGGYKLSANFKHIPEAAPVPNEFTQDLAAAEKAGSSEVNVRGTVAMAKLGSDPNSATSEFFINLADNASNLDAQNGGFTTFATVIGGGMHVADEIAGLKTEDASSENSAFSALPVIRGSTSQNPVVISSAKQQRVLPVTLDSTTKQVTWIDENGGTANITLTHGTANLTFVGGNDMTFQNLGNRVVIHGTAVDLEQVITHNTSKGSILTVTSSGGRGPAHIGDITVDKGSLAEIDGDSVQVRGDITAATGSIGRIELGGTFGTTITAKKGSMDIHVGSMIDTSISTGGTINSLVGVNWANTNDLPSSITAKQINSMTINGDFTTTLNVTNSIGSLTVNGNVGTLGDSKWTVGGGINKVQVGKVTGLTAAITGNLGSFTAREVLLNSTSGTATSISAGSIGTMKLASLTNGSSIISNAGISNITVNGSMDSSTIRAVKNINSITLGSLTGSAGSTSGVRVQSVIYAGVAAAQTKGLVTDKSDFLAKSSALIGRIQVRGEFSNTVIAAPALGQLNLGSVQTINAKQGFGVTAENRIGLLAGKTQRNQTLALSNAMKQADVINYFSSIGIKGDAINAFTVQVV